MDLSRYVDNKSKSDLNETERDALLRCQNKKGGNFIGSLHKTGTVMVERTSDSGLITHNFCQLIYAFSEAFPVCPIQSVAGLDTSGISGAGFILPIVTGENKRSEERRVGKEGRVGWSRDE